MSIQAVQLWSFDEDGNPTPVVVPTGSVLQVTLTDPQEGDTLVYRSGAWVNEPSIPPSWNPGLENNDLTRWGKDNESDWTTFERTAGGGDPHAGEWALSVVQSAARRNMGGINTQVGSTVEGQAVIYGTSLAASWSGLPCIEGDALSFSVWIKAQDGASAGGRAWIVSFQDGDEVSDPLVLTQSYQQLSHEWTAGEFDESSGAAIYIFFEGVETDGYFLDDASFVATPA